MNGAMEQKSGEHHHHHHHSHHHHHQHQHQHHSQQPPGPPPSSQPRPIRNYKLLVDPALVKAPARIYRYDGAMPNDPSYPMVTCKDPRSQLSRIWSRLEIANLPVPRYVVKCFNIESGMFIFYN